MILQDYPEDFEVSTEFKETLEYYILKDFIILEKNSSREYSYFKKTIIPKNILYEDYLELISNNVKEKINADVVSFSKKMLAFCLEFSKFTNVKDSNNLNPIINNIILDNPIEKEILKTLINNNLEGSDNFDKLCYLEDLSLKVIYNLNQY